MTTTILVGDDKLSPPAPRLLGQRLYRAGLRCTADGEVKLSIFLVSVEGRNGGPASYLPIWLYQPSLSAKENLIADMLFSVFASAVMNASRGFTPDLLRVTVEGEVDGVSFRAKDSNRLHGAVTVREVMALINSIVDQAVIAALDGAQAPVPKNANHNFEGTVHKRRCAPLVPGPSG